MSRNAEKDVYKRQKNAFDMEKHLKRRPAIVKPDEVFDYYEIDAADLQEDADLSLIHIYHSGHYIR